MIRDLPSEIVLFGMLLGYKTIILFVGLCIIFMGYRLFLADKVGASGDLEGRTKDYSLSLKGGAPGIFFSLFGSVLICLSIFKGVHYSDEIPLQQAQRLPVLIPATPPKL